MSIAGVEGKVADYNIGQRVEVQMVDGQSWYPAKVVSKSGTANAYYIQLDDSGKPLCDPVEVKWLRPIAERVPAPQPQLKVGMRVRITTKPGIHPGSIRAQYSGRTGVVRRISLWVGLTHYYLNMDGGGESAWPFLKEDLDAIEAAPTAPADKFTPGQKVRITGGPFTGFLGKTAVIDRKEPVPRFQGNDWWKVTVDTRDQISRVAILMDSEMELVVDDEEPAPEPALTRLSVGDRVEVQFSENRWAECQIAGFGDSPSLYKVQLPNEACPVPFPVHRKDIRLLMPATFVDDTPAPVPPADSNPPQHQDFGTRESLSAQGIDVDPGSRPHADLTQTTPVAIANNQDALWRGVTTQYPKEVEAKPLGILDTPIADAIGRQVRLKWTDEPRVGTIKTWIKEKACYGIEFPGIPWLIEWPDVAVEFVTVLSTPLNVEPQAATPPQEAILTINCSNGPTTIFTSKVELDGEKVVQASPWKEAGVTQYRNPLPGEDLTGKRVRTTLSNVCGEVIGQFPARRGGRILWQIETSNGDRRPIAPNYLQVEVPTADQQPTEPAKPETYEDPGRKFNRGDDVLWRNRRWFILTWRMNYTLECWTYVLAPHDKPDTGGAANVPEKEITLVMKAEDRTVVEADPEIHIHPDTFKAITSDVSLNDVIGHGKDGDTVRVTAEFQTSDDGVKQARPWTKAEPTEDAEPQPDPDYSADPLDQMKLGPVASGFDTHLMVIEAIVDWQSRADNRRCSFCIPPDGPITVAVTTEIYGKPILTSIHISHLGDHDAMIDAIDRALAIAPGRDVFIVPMTVVL